MNCEELEFSYTTEKDDYITFNLNHQKLTKDKRNKAKLKENSGLKTKFKNLFIKIISFSILLYLFSILGRGTKPIEGTVVFVITGIMIIYAKHKIKDEMKKSYKLSLSEYYDSNKMLQQKCECKLSMNGLYVEKRNSITNVNWDMIYQIVKTPKYCYIYTAINCAYIIPLKVFDGEDELKKFFSILKSNIDAKKIIIMNGY